MTHTAHEGDRNHGGRVAAGGCHVNDLATASDRRPSSGRGAFGSGKDSSKAASSSGTRHDGGER